MPSSNYSDIVGDSARTGGRDTLANKPTRFLNVENITESESDKDGSKEASFKLWTDEHSALSRERREQRKNREGHVVAEVEEFDVKTHLNNVAAENEKASKPKWKLW